MKRQYSLTIRLVSAVFLLLPLIYFGDLKAASSNLMPVGSCCNSDTSSLFGQTQAYDVLLRGNGEAVVNARITLTNNNDSPLNELNYSVANGQLGDVSAYQEITCNYLPILVPLGTSIPLTGGAAGSAATRGTLPDTVATTDTPQCYPSLTGAKDNSDVASSSSQVVPGIYPQYYYPGGNVYKKVTITKTGNSIGLKLPQSIKNNESTTVVILYNVAGISHKERGVYSYDFKTLKSDKRSSDVSVAISVDENYYLENTTSSNVNYRPPASSTSISSKLQAGAALSSNDSSAVNNYVSSIGDNGSVIKHASQLAPQETLTVTGRFATSTFLLNWPRTLLRWGILCLIIAALLFWYIRRRKKLNRQNSDKDSGNSPDDSGKILTNPATEQVGPGDATQTYSLSYAPHKSASINLRALPFYGLGLSFKRRVQERKIRPLFFAWLCSVLTIILLSIAIGAYALGSNYYGLSNSYLTIGSAICITIIGVLGFLLCCIGLPILYAKTFKGALRIVAHIIIFFVVIGIMLSALMFWLDKNNNPNPSCGGDISNSACVQPL